MLRNFYNYFIFIIIYLFYLLWQLSRYFSATRHESSEIIKFAGSCILFYLYFMLV